MGMRRVLTVAIGSIVVVMLAVSVFSNGSVLASRSNVQYIATARSSVMSASHVVVRYQQDQKLLQLPTSNLTANTQLPPLPPPEQATAEQPAVAETYHVADTHTRQNLLSARNSNFEQADGKSGV